MGFAFGGSMEQWVWSDCIGKDSVQCDKFEWLGLSHASLGL